MQVHDMLVAVRPPGAPVAIGPREMLRVGRWLGVRMAEAEAGALVHELRMRAGRDAQGAGLKHDEIGLEVIAEALFDPAKVRQRTMAAATGFKTEGINGVRQAASREQKALDMAAARLSLRDWCLNEGFAAHEKRGVEKKRNALEYQERKAAQANMKEDVDTLQKIKEFFNNNARSRNVSQALFKSIGKADVPQAEIVRGMLLEWHKLTHRARRDAVAVMEKVQEATRKNNKRLLAQILGMHIPLVSSTWLETLKAAAASLAVTAREGDDEAIECARRLLRHEDAGSRCIAASLLSKLAWTDDRATMEALTIGHHDSDGTVRRATKKASAEIVRRSKIAKRSRSAAA
ncbi:hypothetical protein T484DRAFT_2016840, partial [Baffinella frigidus]